MLNIEKKHYPNVDNIIDVKIGDKPACYKKGRAGAAYERKVATIVQNMFNKQTEQILSEKQNQQSSSEQQIEVMLNPWICYILNDHKMKCCEPDIVVIDHSYKKICVIEVKEWAYLNGVEELVNLYMPIVAKLWTGYEVSGIVVNKKNGSRLKKENIFPKNVSICNVK